MTIKFGLLNSSPMVEFVSVSPPPNPKPKVSRGKSERSEMALRAALLRHVRIPIQTLTLTGRTTLGASSSTTLLRWMSSHGDDHITKEEVIERVLSVVKSFPKVDPSKVSLIAHSVCFLRKFTFRSPSCLIFSPSLFFFSLNFLINMLV